MQTMQSIAMHQYQWSPADHWNSGPVAGTMPPQAGNTPVITSSMLQAPKNYLPMPGQPPALKPEKPLPSRSSAPPQRSYLPDSIRRRERASQPNDPYEGMRDATAPIYMPVDRIIEVPVEKVKLTEIPVLVDKIKFQDVRVEIEKLVIKEIPVPIDKIIEKVVMQEVDKTDYGLIARLKEELRNLQESYARERTDRERERASPEETYGRERADRDRERAAPPVGTFKEVIKEVPVEKVVEKIVYMDNGTSISAAPARPLSSSQTMLLHHRAPARMIGIGLALERNAMGKTFVDRIIPGFAASLSERFQVGDVVVAINDVPLHDWALDAIKQLTVGEEGSMVQLEIQRGSQSFAVALRRQFPDFIDESNSEAQQVLSRSSPLSLMSQNQAPHWLN